MVKLVSRPLRKKKNFLTGSFPFSLPQYPMYLQKEIRRVDREIKSSIKETPEYLCHNYKGCTVYPRELSVVLKIPTVTQ